jgi:hypothetical protein
MPTTRTPSFRSVLPIRQVNNSVSGIEFMNPHFRCKFLGELLRILIFGTKFHI